jgi:5-formyltetrahydrofolate cyclo-ligase
MGPSDRADRRQRTDAMRRRKAERQRLIKERLAIPGDLPRAHGEKIAASFEHAIGDVAAPTVSACWTFRGEPGTGVDSSIAFAHLATARRRPS